MRLVKIYPKNKEDKMFKKIEDYVAEKYPYTIIKSIRICKDAVFVKTNYSTICIRKCVFNESKK